MHPILISLETSAFSGATLLAILLGSHPNISTIGEVHGLIEKSDPDTYLCSCGKKIKDCEFWFQVRKSMENKGYSFDIANFKTKYHYEGPQIINDFLHGSSRNRLIDTLRDKVAFNLPKEVERMQRYTDRNAALIDSVLEVTGNNVFVDSSKSRMLLRTFPTMTNFDVRAIHLIRRPEGVVASQLRRSGEEDPTKEARSWVKRHRRIELSMKFLKPEKTTWVRYEDLCQDPETTLRGLFEFCGVDPDTSKLNFDVKAQHVIGNPMRLRPLSEISLDERWRKELDQNQINIIQKITSGFGKRYGYKVN